MSTSDPLDDSAGLLDVVEQDDPIADEWITTDREFSRFPGCGGVIRCGNSHRPGQVAMNTFLRSV